MKQFLFLFLQKMLVWIRQFLPLRKCDSEWQSVTGDGGVCQGTVPVPSGGFRKETLQPWEEFTDGQVRGRAEEPEGEGPHRQRVPHLDPIRSSGGHMPLACRPACSRRRWGSPLATPAPLPHRAVHLWEQEPACPFLCIFVTNTFLRMFSDFSVEVGGTEQWDFCGNPGFPEVR